MSTISIDDIRHDPVDFVRRIEAGETFVVVSGESPLAEIRPLTVTDTDATPRPFGLCSGRFKVPADFDRPLSDDVLKEFEGQ